jgi:P-type Na+/K+ transporter
MVVYGLWIAVLCLASFCVVLYGYGDGNLGSSCNETPSPDCDLVFRARATCFALLTWMSLFLAWELVDLRRSFFHRPNNLSPINKKSKTLKFLPSFLQAKLRNRFLAVSILVGFVTIWPLLYIPVLNGTVFKHAPIDWEWGVVFAATIAFFAGIEGWKFLKRGYFRRQRGRNEVNEKV